MLRTPPSHINATFALHSTVPKTTAKLHLLDAVLDVELDVEAEADVEQDAEAEAMIIAAAAD